MLSFLLDENLEDKQLIVSDCKCLQEEIRKLEQSIDNIKNEIDKTETEVNDFYEIMKLENKSLIKKGDDINIDIELLKSQLCKFKNKEELYSNKEESYSNKEEKDEECKQLYRSIAKQCHSDVSKDKSLKDLFIRATNAYNRNDYHELLEIKENINTGEIFDNLPLKFKRLKSELKKHLKELNRLKKLFLYCASQHYKKGDELNIMMAQKIFSDWLYQRIIQMIRERKSLQNELDSIISIKSF